MQLEFQREERENGTEERFKEIKVRNFQKQYNTSNHRSNKLREFQAEIKHTIFQMLKMDDKEKISLQIQNSEVLGGGRLAH